MSFDYDVIVIGSGFGGSVMTCRLAEKGYSVCLLERGKRYGFGEFPRRTHEAKKLFWDPENKLRGLFEVNFFPKSDAYIVAGSGLGGGSLIYANVLMKMPEDFFLGWPGGINREALDPYYSQVLDMMEASPYPFETDPYYKDTPKTMAMVNEIKNKEFPLSPDETQKPEWVWPDLAITFKGDFPGEQSKNKQGVVQSKCIKCGECDLGCNIHSKNTLDLNYLARAENQKLLGDKGKAATIKTNALVTEIIPIKSGGYEVHFYNPANGDKEKLSSKKVVVSAGSYGSTSLLLKQKNKGNLPHLSEALGHNWCGNGDLEGMVFNSEHRINPTVGPVITCGWSHRYKNYPDGFPHGLIIQDAGLPSFLTWYLIGKVPSLTNFYRQARFFILMGLRFLGFCKEINVGSDIVSLLEKDDFVRKTMVLLGMGRDRNNGKIYLDDSGEAQVKWQMEKGSEIHYERVRGEMSKIASALGGKFQDNPLTYFNKMIAVHPLGGCTMADNPKDGVVNARGEAYGHPGLYVVDASILPTSTGVNPSLTIAAMAERIATYF